MDPGPASTPAWVRVTAAALLVTFCAVVAVITFWPGPPDPDGQRALRAFLEDAHLHGLPLWISFGKVEFGANILMFVPIGFFGALVLPRLRALIVPAAASRYPARAPIPLARTSRGVPTRCCPACGVATGGASGHCRRCTEPDDPVRGRRPKGDKTTCRALTHRRSNLGGDRAERVVGAPIIGDSYHPAESLPGAKKVTWSNPL